MNGFLGKDGFAWFFGVVEDRKDPLKIGRVRVRILGFHDDDKNVLPTTELPWATPVQPITSAGIGGKGITPVGLLEGTWVLGFFTDPGSYQIPMVLGSISGLNSKTIKKLGEDPGNAFRDLRTAEQLNKSPKDKFKNREYPDGKGKDGDKHGAQLENSDDNSPNPKPAYTASATDSEDGTPDTNILGINDTSRIDQTPVAVKNASRDDGGTREMAVPVADINFDKFSTGVINQSGANKGTNKGLGVGYNGVESSSKPSLKQNYKQFKDKPTNANGQTVYGTGTAAIGATPVYSPISISTAAACYKDTMSNVVASASTIRQQIRSQTESTVSRTGIQRKQTNDSSLRSSSIGSYVPTSDGVSRNPSDKLREDQDKLNKLKNAAEIKADASQETQQTSNISLNNQQTINNMPIVVDNFGNISVDGNDIPVMDVTDKLKDQDCGDCGCQGEDCK